MAVDVGFGRVKALNENMKEANFPAAIASFQPLQFASGMESGESLAIEYNDRAWWIGEAALRQSTAARMTTDRTRTTGEEGMALLAAGMALLAKQDHELVNLVVGLPVKFFAGMKAEYAKLARDVHKVGILSPSGSMIKARRVVIVEQVKTLPQPFGTLFDVLLDNSGNLQDKALAGGRVGVIDIGFNTLDLCRADELEYNNPQSDSFSGQGLFSAFQELSREIYRELEIELPPERLEPVVRDRKITLAGKEHDVSELIDRAFSAAAEGILSRIRSLWPDRDRLMFNAILITGGGGSLLGKYLTPYLGAPARIVEGAVMANCRGYLKFARRCWK
jgi:plasmid segregation protein ParM